MRLEDFDQAVSGRSDRIKMRRGSVSVRLVGDVQLGSMSREFDLLERKGGREPNSTLEI